MTSPNRHFPSAPTPSPELGETALPVQGLSPRLEGLLGDIQNRVAARARSSRVQAVFVAGKVEAFDPVTRSSRRLVAGDLVSTDMTLRAGDGKSRAMLRLDDGSELWLGANSELDLSSWTAGGTRRMVRLESGRLLAFVAKNARRFIVQLRRGAQVEAVGTSFDIQATDTDIQVDVISGVVAMRNRKGNLTGKLGDRLEILAGDLPRKRRGTPAASSRWMREAQTLTGASQSDDWLSIRDGVLKHAYRNATRSAVVAAAGAWMASSRNDVAALAAVGVLGATAWNAHEQGLLFAEERFSREEVAAAVNQLQREQIEKHGEKAESEAPENELGVMHPDSNGRLRWHALSEQDLNNLQNAAIPESLKRNLIAGAARARESGSVPVSNNVIELDGATIDYSNDALATGDFVKWLEHSGVSREEAKRRAAMSLSHSIRERLPEPYRREARIPVYFDESKKAE